MNFKLAIVSAILLVLSACNPIPTNVEAGYVGVKVNLLGGDKGVQNEVIGVGRYWPTINEDIYRFPTFTQTRTWFIHDDMDERISFQTGDGMKVTTGVGVSYRVDPTKVAVLFQTYRRGIDEITDIYLHNMIRDAFVEISSKHPVEYVYGEGKADLVRQVQDMVASQVAPKGIIIEKVYLVGDLILPNSVQAAINAKIVATQKTQQRENEIAQTKAEALKAIEAARGRAESLLTVARAEAEANRLKQETLTEELIRYTTVQRWNGQGPTTVLGSGATPMVYVK